MSIYITVIFAVFGLVIGSFLNVCIYRMPKNISVAKGRSYCPKCDETLSPLELVPVLSFLALRGRCRHCKAKISPRYAAVELLTAILFALCGYFIAPYSIVFAAVYAIFFAILIVITFIDLDTMEVPDRLHICIAILALACMYFRVDEFWYYLLGAVIVSIPMLIIAIITGGFGGADIKLMAAAGLLLGAKSIVVSFLAAILIMGSIGVVLIIRKIIFKREYNKKMPFCPALTFGCVTGTFLGDIISGWYFSLLT